MSLITIYQGDNLPIVKKLPTESVDLIYIDPPFNTGKIPLRINFSAVVLAGEIDLSKRICPKAC